MNENPRSPVKAIRKHCIECAGNSSHEVKLCLVVKCPLYPFRFGKNPFRNVTMTEDQKAALAERLKNARNSNAEKDFTEREENYTVADSKAAKRPQEALKCEF